MGTSSDFIKGVYDAFAKGDVPAVLGAFDPRIEWHEAENFLYAEGSPYVGPAAIAKDVFQRVVSDVEDFAVVPQRFTDGGDSVVVEGRYRGKWRATGAQIDAQFAHVWRLRNGLVVSFHQYTDTRQWARAASA